MSVGVFTRMKRVKFVSGWETGGTDPEDGSLECGHRTAFPIEITLAQLEELVYRVKDAIYTAGELEFTANGGTVQYIPPSSYHTERTGIDGGCFTTRGYSYAGTDEYNGSEYTVGSDTYSDIGDNERGMWRTIWNTPRTISSSHSLTDAFTFYSNTPSGSSDFGWQESGGLYGLFAESIRGIRVAVVKSSPSDGFFATTNKFFLEFEFHWFDYAEVGPVFGGGTNSQNPVNGIGDWGSTAEVLCNYVIRLASGDISCPIYINDAFDEITSPGGSDIIHEGVEWWPYAKAGGAVWNTGTGAKI